MFRSDYLLRMIEQFTETLGVLLGLRREQKPEQALAMIDELLRNLLRLNSKTTGALSVQDLLAMMSAGGTLETDKILMVARLLKEEGDIYDLLDDPEEAYRRHLKSLDLFLAASPYDTEKFLVDGDAEIKELLDRLQPYELPKETLLNVWLYLEKMGRYSDAEDLLFNLLDREDTDGERLISEGLRFYERLLEKDDSELLAGNLPREEVVSAIEQLRSKSGS